MLAAKFIELLRLTKYLILGEEKKTQKCEEGLNYRIYERVLGFQTQNFSELVDKATMFE